VADLFTIHVTCISILMIKY